MTSCCLPRLQTGIRPDGFIRSLRNGRIWVRSQRSGLLPIPPYVRGANARFYTLQAVARLRYVTERMVTLDFRIWP